MKKPSEPARILTYIIILLSTVASAGGLFIQGLYRDHDTIKRAWLGSDITTLLLAVPLLAFSLRLAARGSLRGQLIWIGLLGYMLYNYAFYLFGAVFNDFFLVYSALFTTSIYALVLSLSNLDVKLYQIHPDSDVPVKWISIFLVLVSLPLAIFELSHVLTAMALEKEPTIPSLIFALDLSLIIPNMLLAAILLWKRLAWGFILTSIMLVKGFTYGINLIISSASVAAFGTDGDWDVLTPFYLFITIGSLVAGFQLLKNLKPS